MKSCVSVFTVVSLWIIFFYLNSFSFPVSPEFSIMISLQGIITSLCSFGKTKPSPLPYHKGRTKPSPCFSLPHPSHGLSSAAPPAFMNGDATSLNATSTPLETSHQGYPQPGFALHGWNTLMTIFIMTGSVTQCFVLISISSWQIPIFFSANAPH